MIIKVCGMRDPQNIRELSVLNINWMGLIFYHGSPRDITNVSEYAKGFHIPVPFRKVGVFVDSTPEEILKKKVLYKLDYVQLHGNESPDFCHTLQKRGISLIKAFPIASREDLLQTSAYEGYVDYFLFDTKCPGYGGSGQLFDWSILSYYSGTTPFLLSGGINPGSVKEIQQLNHPQLAGIDINSGFEIEPGIKDVNKINLFIQKL